MESCRCNRNIRREFIITSSLLMALRSTSEMLAFQSADDPNTARRATLPARRAGSTMRMSVYKDKVAVITDAGSGIGRNSRDCWQRRAHVLHSRTSAMLAGRHATAVRKCRHPDIPRRRFEARAGLRSRAAGEARLRRRRFRLQQCRGHADRNLRTQHDRGDRLAAGIDLWGVIYGTKAFLPMMLEQRSGCIVNLSSIFGLVGVPTQSAYNMSKFAVRGL